MTVALRLSDDERMLVDTVGGFLSDTAPVTAFRAARDAGEAQASAALWAQMCELGLPAIFLPEDAGGAGADRAAACLIAEQAGHVLAASPFIPTVVAIDLLSRIGTDPQSVGALATGGTRIALAIDERARHAPDAIAATLSRGPDGFVLTGAKRFVAEGGAADRYLVVARDAAGPLLLMVPRDAAGLTVTPLALVDSRDWADLTFDDVALPADALIAEGPAAQAAIDAALDFGRVLTAFELYGMADTAFVQTIAFLNHREQFGVTIGSFQALQHRAARLHIALEVARSVLLKAARALDTGAGASDLASLAKLHATRTARAVLDEAIQLHGGIGVTDELDIGLFFKRVRTAGEWLGDDAFHKARLAHTRLAAAVPAG